MKNRKDYSDFKKDYGDLIRISVINFLISVIIITMPGFLFAASQVATTATATVAPEGHFAPVITASDQTVREGEVLQFEVLAADANVEDTVTLEITQGQTSWLSIVSNTDGNTAKMVLSAAPPIGAAGKFKVTFKATDNSSPPLSATKAIFITVNPANQAPVITAENQNAQVGQLLSFTMNCQDADSGDTITLTYSGKPAWLNASASSPVAGNPVNVTFTGTPQAGDVGSSTMTFSAVDNGTPQQSASKSITITVSIANDPPVLTPIRNKAVPIRVKLEFTISATDPNGDALTYIASGLPLSIGATFNSSTRKFTWTPTSSQAGNYFVHFEVSDNSLTDSEDIAISVTSDDTPIFDPLSDQYIKVDKTLSFVVNARDPNNDPLAYSSANLPLGASLNNATHTFNWTPLSGQEGTYTDVEFSASDGTNTAVKRIKIFVRPRNAPDLDPIGDKHVKAGQLLSFTINATDPNGDSLDYSVANNPPGSSLVGQTFSWTPASNQVGAHPDVAFTVSDGVNTDSKIIWIFVESSSSPSIEHIDDKTVVEGRTLSFTVNATDPDSSALTYSALNLPAGAEFNSSTRAFTWTPAIGQRGAYKDVRFRVTDGTSTVDEDIWIFVNANGEPIIDPMTDKYVKTGELLSFDVSAYDPNGDDLAYQALNLPSGAAFSNRTFTWTPGASQVGTYKDITFQVSDGVNVVTKAIWIFVSASDAPVLDAIGDKNVTAGDTLTFTVTASDPDTAQSGLAFTASNLPSGATFNTATHVFNWTPNSGQVGAHRDVAFRVADGVNTDTKVIWIFVKAAGAPTISVPGDKTVRAGSQLQFTITATDPDTPQSGLTFSASNLPSGATFANQIFTWTPTADQIGTYPDVGFTVTDGTNTDSKALWIFVTAAGAPEFSQDVTDKNGRIGEPIIFSVTATDPDHSQSQLTFSAFNLPTNATFTNQTFNWIPQAGQAGTYKDVRLEVNDPDNNIDADTFWIFIAQNNPPVLDFIGTKFGTVNQLLTFTISATDPDGDTLTYSASNLPSGATFNSSTRTFSWTPTSTGTFSGVRFTVSDGAFTDSEDISIVISS